MSYLIFNLKIGDKEAINKYRALLYRVKLHNIVGRALVYKLSFVFLGKCGSYSVEIETY